MARSNSLIFETSFKKMESRARMCVCELDGEIVETVTLGRHCEGGFEERKGYRQVKSETTSE